MNSQRDVTPMQSKWIKLDPEETLDFGYIWMIYQASKTQTHVLDLCQRTWFTLAKRQGVILYWYWWQGREIFFIFLSAIHMRQRWFIVHCQKYRWCRSVVFVSSPQKVRSGSWNTSNFPVFLAWEFILDSTSDSDQYVALHWNESQNIKLLANNSSHLSSKIKAIGMHHWYFILPYLLLLLTLGNLGHVLDFSIYLGLWRWLWRWWWGWRIWWTEI